MRILLVALALSVLLVAAPAHAQAPAAPVSYAGKTALVTGSTDGLGRELALAGAIDDVECGADRGCGGALGRRRGPAQIRFGPQAPFET